MDILIQDYSNDKYVQLPEDTHAIFHSLKSRTPFLINKSRLGLTEPPKDEAWHSVERMELANNKLSELPLSPSSPVLKVLLLQGNVDLTRIPNTFFLKMPLLKILDLSYTSLRELPDSFFELEQLREMYLKGCECFMKLSPKIGKLKNLEKLDLDGTQIIHLPEEIQELTNLQSLFLCFYEYRGRKGKQYTCSTIIPSEVISKLKGLKHLSIDVNPDDERWYENIQHILPEILGLEHLLTLSLYIPHLELLKAIPDRMFQVDFRFIVGRHMQRIISSTPSRCEAKFKQSACSLKFVNGDDVPNEITRLVRHSKALFLERHKTIKNMLKFKMMNLEQLRICMLAECKEMQTVVDGRQSNRNDDIFSHLLYLYISHMKSLRSIWEGPVPPHCFLGMLKSLVLQNCPELTTIFTVDFLGNLSLLKELIVKDCPKVTTLISDGSLRHKMEIFLPKLRKIMLLHLPKLITISNGCCIGPSLNKMAIYDCPKLQSLSKLELSSQNLKIIKGEIKWWDQLLWREEWGLSQRPSRFDHIFSSIDNQVDIMTQIGIDGDDIDDDEDMTQLQTIFEHPKQNADIISRKTSPESSKISEEGQKTEGSKNTRRYNKCTYAGCPVKNKVQISAEEDPRIMETIYNREQTHTSPQYNRSLYELQSKPGIVDEPLRSSNDKKLSRKRGVIRVSRASGGKDRHSKVMTSKGVKDRRVRLSTATAIQFYDLQDRLGYDQPSKAVEWLIKAASDAISELPSLNNTFPDTLKQPSDEKRETEQGFDNIADVEVDGDDGDDNQSQSQNLSLFKSACTSTSETSKGSGLSLSRSEIRVKARERARERTGEKKEKKNTTTHNPDNNVNNPISQTVSFTGGVTSTVNPSTTSPGGDDHEPDLFSKTALKYKAFQPSRLRIMTDRKQIANRSSRRSDTSTQASQATNPALFYSINQGGNSASNADLESFSSMGGWIQPSANETYGHSVDTN